MRTWMLVVAALACSGAPDARPVEAAAAVPAVATDTAVFGGGCFWCVEEAFDKAPGVVSTISGYTGGRTRNPTYAQVSSGRTGHVEVVQVVYDPRKISYAQLLDVFWRNVDPLTANQQFCDRGAQYRSVIYYRGEEQRRQAETSRQALETSRRFDRPIVTEVTAAARFYPAEEYHQDYYTKNPVRYRYYKFSCGRARRLEELWGK